MNLSSVPPSTIVSAAFAFFIIGAGAIGDDKSTGVAAGKEKVPEKLAALGELKNDVGLWLSLDSVENGGVGWARFPLTITATANVAIREKDGRKYADFSTAGALLLFERPFDLGDNYTLSTWMRFPMPHKHGTVWQGGGPEATSGAALYVTDMELCGWSEKTHKSCSYGTLPAGLEGWHHVAVSADGKTTRAYLDGKEVGSVNEIVSINVKSIGSHWHKPHQHWMMCDGVDDQLFFRRALTAEEIKKVSEFGKPETK